MEPCRKELEKGVFLTTVTTDRFKSALLTVHLLLPLAKETASAHSLLTDVLMRGTEQYPTMRDLNRRQDELYSLGLGSFVQVKGETQIITFELSAIDDRFAYDETPVLKEGMKLLNQLIFHPFSENGCFKKEYVKQEKKNLIDEIRSEINNKTSFALRQCRRKMCKNELYAVDGNGTEADVKKLNAKKLTAVYRSVLEKAAVEILYVGAKPQSEIEALVRDDLPFAGRDATPAKTNFAGARKRVKTYREKMDVAQCQMVIGFRSEETGKELPLGCKPLFAELFSASPVSRLFMQVREKLQLCYSCFARFDNFKKVMFVSCGLEEKNVGRAKKQILYELKELQNGKITEDELLSAKRSLAGALSEVYDSTSSLTEWYLSQICSGRLLTPLQMAEKISEMTAKDVAAFASCLKPDTVYLLKGGEADEME